MVVFCAGYHRCLRGEDNYAKNRNYWKYLKTRLIKENNELVSVTNQLKLTASEGKKYRTDARAATYLQKERKEENVMRGK